jgi:hypothetical protein
MAWAVSTHPNSLSLLQRRNHHIYHIHLYQGIRPVSKLEMKNHKLSFFNFAIFGHSFSKLPLSSIHGYIKCLCIGFTEYCIRKLWLRHGKFSFLILEIFIFFVFFVVFWYKVFLIFLISLYSWNKLNKTVALLVLYSENARFLSRWERRL